MNNYMLRRAFILTFIYYCRLTSATRTHASQEFNHGLVFSSMPLQDDQIFEVQNKTALRLKHNYLF